MRLVEIKKLEGTITLKSGLHIGSGNMEMHIGGTDSPVIKHPHTLEPYIPGSSLKGKVRSLLEMESGLMVHTDGNVVSSKTLQKVSNDHELKDKCEAILKIFGSSGADIEDETGFGPTRVSFADCYLDNEWKNKAKDNRWLLTEEKSENVINRIKGTAEHPRFIERVPEGTKFKFLVTFKVLQDDDNLFDDFLLKGLKLLEMDALGGSGSRGYGRIAFEFNDQTLNEKFHSLDPFQEEQKA
ncbi:MAG: type III-A CRISPR-associated RAMP protein Csm3 [Thermodesulfovibrio sp. RBG_19FT_COMBO_42_12]|nr:MAG: type III-A CRISPR-associated RAMP protein Csm3 [Thermodesulfovibrio sp. RBG_19FT_COMBO_42_12]